MRTIHELEFTGWYLVMVRCDASMRTIHEFAVAFSDGMMLLCGVTTLALPWLQWRFLVSQHCYMGRKRIWTMKLCCTTALFYGIKLIQWSFVVPQHFWIGRKEWGRWSFVVSQHCYMAINEISTVKVCGITTSLSIFPKFYDNFLDITVGMVTQTHSFLCIMSVNKRTLVNVCFI